MLMRIQTLWNNLLHCGGILTGKMAFVGPHTAQIFISNYCTENCPWCGVHSKLLNYELDLDFKRRFITTGLFKKIINELAESGTIKILLFGLGEPLLHPNILDMIKYIKKTKMKCALSTNGLLLNEKIAEELGRLGIYISISLHSNDFDNWKKIFPNRSYNEFEKIRKAIYIISKYKQSKLTLHATISNENYLQIKKIIDLALAVKAYAISFVPTSIFDGTESLRLDENQNEILKNELIEAYNLAVRNGIRSNIGEFLKLTYPKSDLSFSTVDIYKNIPCYLGWLRTYITVDGDIFPCCISKEIMGNVNKNSFKHVWNSEKYKEFRSLKNSKEKRMEIFPTCKCDECPDYYYNLKAHSYLHLKF